MTDFNDFAEFSKRDVPLAPYTGLRLGGPADYIVQPRSREELSAVVKHCADHGILMHVLGGGCNILVPDEGVRGVVIRLCEPAFTQFTVRERIINAGAGAALADLITFAAQHGLAGLEVLVGIPGTVGGAVRGNAGDRMGEIGQFVHSVEVLDHRGMTEMRERDELQFAPRWSNIEDPVMITADFELESEDPDAIVKRMRKAWIQRKATEPLTFEAHARLFRNPPGLDAAALIEEAGLAKTQVGHAELSARNPNAVVVQHGGTAREVSELIERVRQGVDDRFGINLGLDLIVW